MAAASLVPAAVPFVPFRIGRYDWTARQHFEQALAIDQSAYGPNDSRVADRQNELGTVLADLGDAACARTHHERALAIDEAVLGPDHPMVAAGRGNLNRIVQELGHH